ncbi:MULTISPECIES: histidine phosphatase family protein [unclassified Shewanella]|uniref:histidine phosphatase family protein n=1 Tax=unclassified Shewanella TaxID=196818 RepID=UPI00354D9D86
MQQAKMILLRHGQCEGGNILRGKTDVALTPLGVATMEASVKKLGGALQAASLTIYSSPLIRCQQFAQNLVADINQNRSFSQQLNANEPVNKREFDCQTSLLAEVIQMPQFQEVDFGDWDGQTFDALYQHDGQAVDRYWTNPWLHTPPNGETMLEFEARVTNGLAEVSGQLAAQLSSLKQLKGQVSGESSLASSPETDSDIDFDNGTATGNEKATALIVTHGGVIRCIMSHILGLDQCAGLYSQLAIDYGATVVIDVYWPEQAVTKQSFNCASEIESTQSMTRPAASKPVYRLHWPS